MIQVKYVCTKHGKFSVAVQATGGWQFRGAAPDRAPCPACEQSCRRATRRGRTLSVSARLFARLKAYAEAKGVPMRKIIAEATRDVDLLQLAADRILRRRGDP